MPIISSSDHRSISEPSRSVICLLQVKEDIVLPAHITLEYMKKETICY